MCDRACQPDDMPEQLRPTLSYVMYVYNIGPCAACMYMQHQCAVEYLLLI